MNPSPSTIREATLKQLRYLRVLAEQTGTSFTNPGSSSQASREIQRLTELKKARGRYVELPEDDDVAKQLVYGTAPQADEISRGRDSHASWKTAHRPTQDHIAKASIVGDRTELARYTAGDEERLVEGQRVNGVVRVTDRPASNRGRSYLVERGLEQDGYAALQALVADYTRQASRLAAVPMSTSAVRHTIEQEAS
jgi:hypothetical protein